MLNIYNNSKNDNISLIKLLMPKCLHNRRKIKCHECGYIPKLCSHNRQKSGCYECGYISKLCPHNRRKTRCYECEGGSICPHNRQKSKCHECLADNDNRIPEVEEYSKDEYKIC